MTTPEQRAIKHLNNRWREICAAEHLRPIHLQAVDRWDNMKAEEILAHIHGPGPKSATWRMTLYHPHEFDSNAFCKILVTLEDIGDGVGRWESCGHPEYVGFASPNWRTFRCELQKDRAPLSYTANFRSWLQGRLNDRTSKKVVYIPEYPAPWLHCWSQNAYESEILCEIWLKGIGAGRIRDIEVFLSCTTTSAWTLDNAPARQFLMAQFPDLSETDNLRWHVKHPETFLHWLSIVYSLTLR